MSGHSEADPVGHGISRPATEPSRLGRVPMVGLVVVLVVGFVIAASDGFTALYFVFYACVGAILAVRRPRNPIGWLLVGVGFGFIGTSTPPGAELADVAAGTASTTVRVSVWLAGWSGTAWYLGLFALMVVFPSGRLPEGRWRLPSGLLLALGALMVVLTAISPTFSISVADGVETITVANPFAILPDLPLWDSLASTSELWSVALVALLIVGVASIIARYRRSTGILRLQLRWLVASLSFLVVALLIGLASAALFADVVGGLGWSVALVAFPTVPIAIVVAVLRYHLLEIDRIVSRTVGYALVTGILAVLYAGSILLLQGALVAVTQAQTIAVATSTLAVLALFQPVRRRVQRIVDRRFDRAHYDAERTSVQFAERLRHEVDIHAVSADLEDTVRAAIQPERLGLWLRRGADGMIGGGVPK